MIMWEVQCKAQKGGETCCLFDNLLWKACEYISVKNLADQELVNVVKPGILSREIP